MDLQTAIGELEGLGCRLDRIMPADDPTSASLSLLRITVHRSGP